MAFQRHFRNFWSGTGKWKNRGASAIILTLFLWYMGIFTHLFEENYYTQFSNYPLRIDMGLVLETYRLGDKYDGTVQPINFHNFSFLIKNEEKCRNEGSKNSFKKVALLFVVKSAVGHFEKRNIIRRTWAWEQRFSDVVIRRVFALGMPGVGGERGGATDSARVQTQIQKINLEQQQHKDLFQADFIDAYYNNTIKTLASMQWVLTYCPEAKYILFVDDDYYVSTKNLLRFIRNPNDYPAYLQRYLLSNPGDNSPGGRDLLAKPRLVEYEEDADKDVISSMEKMFVGYVFFSGPMRHRPSKWYMPLEEYPYHKYPPYVTAGAYLASMETVRDLYITSLFTQRFRFDDVYLGILAKRAGITPTHNPHFHFYKPSPNAETFKYMIASHGYDNPAEMEQLWHSQKTLGNA